MLKLIVFMVAILLLHCLSAKEVSFDKLLDVIAKVESGGNHMAVNKKEDARGMYQIRKPVIDDVNNLILKQMAYKHDDAFNPKKAKEIAKFYLLYWGKHYTKMEGKNPTYEVYARIWNGGPRGYKKESTVKYWKKIAKIIGGKQMKETKNQSSGLYLEWYGNGVKSCSRTYKAGKEDGLSEWWYPNGKKSCSVNYKDGKEDGLSEGWHENGVKAYSIHYKVGKRDGWAEGWYSNKVKSYSATYKDGKEDGLSEWWNDNGVKAYSINYKDGKEDGLSEGWHENGVKAYSKTYKAGKKEGLAEEWNVSGDMVFRGVYDNDKLVKRLSPDISLQEAIDKGEIAVLSLELQDLVKHAANGYIKKEGKNERF